ncbi:MAG TPA: hypothetical protein VGN57_13235 [Pirellulaceae bacterium]|jgi:hypothetical protein|nr:hypothetical protein [Pirellulaceae bacterium]
MGRSAVRLVVLAILALATPNASRGDTVDDFGQWTAFFTQGELGGDSSPIRYWFDGQVRLLEDADGFNQSLVRPGLGWALRTGQTTLSV